MTYANADDFEDEGKGGKLVTLGATLVGATLGGIGARYVLKDAFPGWHGEDTIAWLSYSLAPGHDPIAVSHYWNGLAADFYPAYLAALAAGTALGGGLASVAASDRPVEQTMGAVAGMSIMGGVGAMFAMPHLAATPM